MTVVVLVKYVPDAVADRGFTADLRCDRSDGLLCEMDEYALEAARQISEKSGSEVVAITVGPDAAEDAVRRALAMGADRAIHVCDPAIAGSDAMGTTRVLVAAIRQVDDVELVLAGASSTDGATGLVPVHVATLMGLPVLIGAQTIEVDAGRVRIVRAEDRDDVTLSAPLPAVVSVTDRYGEPAFPTARAVMMARRRSVEQFSLADFGLDPAAVGSEGALTQVIKADLVPPRPSGRVVHDDGTAGAQLAEFLTALTA